jgi:hypothetical protein
MRNSRAIAPNDAWQRQICELVDFGINLCDARIPGLFMKYHIVSAALLCAALVLYMTGAMGLNTNLGVFLIVAGFSCEFLFWTRILRTKARGRSKMISD